MGTNATYWIWLQRALGYGSGKIQTILSDYGSARDFYGGGIREWRLCGCFTPQELTKLEDRNLLPAEQILARCAALGQCTVTPEDEDYPERLRNIANPPAVLYCKGSLPKLDDEVCIAVVGTRSATPYGVAMSFEFGFQLAKAGAVVVSGGALGVDCASHKGALQAGGKTIAVLGCGINTDYLRENASLRNLISKDGTLVSEYPPDTPAFPRNFPMRNRIISGLSLGILVIEAGEKSGSLITANFALEQGRDVFALPGNVKSSVSDGTNNLIKAGAKPTTCVQDIVEEYIMQYPHKLKQIDKNAPVPSVSEPVKVKNQVHKKRYTTYNEDKKIVFEPQPLPKELSAYALALYKELTQQPCHLTALAKQAGLSVSESMQAVTELELFECIYAQSGRRYSLPKDRVKVVGKCQN